MSSVQGGKLLPGNGLWRTKSVEQSIADTDEPDTKLRRNLSTWDLTVFGVAVVIGAGIFTLTVDWGALLLVVGLATLLVLGTKLSSRVSMVITGIKVAIVLFVIVLGIFYIKGANYSPYVPAGTPGSAGGKTGVDQSLFSLLAGGSSSSFGIFG